MIVFALIIIIMISDFLSKNASDLEKRFFFNRNELF